jgi:hypothetical protein
MIASMVSPARCALLCLAALLGFPGGASAETPGTAAATNPATGRVATAPDESGSPPPAQVVTIYVPAEPAQPTPAPITAPPPEAPPPPPTTRSTSTTPQTRAVPPAKSATPSVSHTSKSRPRPRGGASTLLIAGGRVAPPSAIVPRARRAVPLAAIPASGDSGIAARVRQSPRWLVGTAAGLVAAECLLLIRLGYRRLSGSMTRRRNRRRMTNRS